MIDFYHFLTLTCDFFNSSDAINQNSPLTCDNSVLTTLIQVLPKSPEAIRLPTIITRLQNSGTLAGNLLLEMYSGIWQYLTIWLSFKMTKTFFRLGKN